MFTGWLRRALGILAAISMAVLPLVVQPQVAAEAAATGTLFGLGPNSIITIDPATGASSTFVSLPAVATFPGSSFNNLASDVAGHRLFTERTVYTQDPTGITATYQIVTVNTSDATAPPAVSPDMASGITDLVYDPSSQTLLGQTNMCCPFQLVRIDPATGAQTHVADLPGVQPLRMTIAPAKHVIYVPIDYLNLFPRVDTIATIDTTTGAVSESPAMAAGVFALEYDTISGVLYGKTFCCPANIVTVNPVTGAQTTVAAVSNMGSGITIDSGTHTIYMTDDELGAFSFNQFIVSVNLQNGAALTSTGPLPSGTYVGALAFEGVAITPASIKADVQAALSSGAISNAGVAAALLSQLNEAQAARARGQCSTSVNLYQAFINTVNAASGKTVAASTAANLVNEAQFLIANCP
jgi:hypothetical protein